MQNEDIGELDHIAQAIAHVQNTATANRDALLSLLLSIGVEDGRKFLYDDREQKYQEIDRFVKFEGQVSTVESFAELVLEEGLRRGAPVKAGDDGDVLRLARNPGDYMTVVFGEKGASFSPDDRIRLDEFGYARELSPQWKSLVSVLGKALEHKQLVTALQLLRPSIVGYADVIRQFRKITFTDKTNIVSEPLLQAGTNENVYRVEVQAEGPGSQTAPTTKTALPSEFDIQLQYARGSEKRYRTTIAVDLTTVTKNADRKELRFTLSAPDLPNVEEQAVDDEVAYFREQTKEMPRLLTLVDF